jgi:hypothetical protein
MKNILYYTLLLFTQPQFRPILFLMGVVYVLGWFHPLWGMATAGMFIALTGLMIYVNNQQAFQTETSVNNTSRYTVLFAFVTAFVFSGAVFLF